MNGAYDQKQVLLNSIFLKQIWNAIRLCIQKNFLPHDVEKLLENQPKDFDNYDISVLDKKIFFDHSMIKIHIWIYSVLMIL